MHFLSVNNNNGIYSHNSFTAADRGEQKRTVTPINPCYDSFAAVAGINQIQSPLGKLAGKLFEKVKEVSSDVADKVSNFDKTQKINQIKLTKLMVNNGTYTSYIDAAKHQDEIKELAKLDYNQVEKKYLAIAKNLEYRAVDKKSTEYYQTMSRNSVIPVLMYEKLTPSDINAIYKIKNNRKQNKSNTNSELNFSLFVRKLAQYENFENLSARSQKDLMDNEHYTFATYNGITLEEAKELGEWSSLTKFQYIKDLQSVSSKDELMEILQERRKNIPCSAIPVDKLSIEKVTSEEGIENLKNALSKTDLTKYEKGFPLEYSRAEFIEDFSALTNGLSAEDKKQVFEYFQFKTVGNNDMENYPNPYAKSKIADSNIDMDKYQALVDKFMLNNRIKLDPQDKELENALNDIIKAFPEFISVMGKVQHRGDTIDYHTCDDLKRIMNDPHFDELEPNEKKILMVATLFHDFGKDQNVIDDGHALKSAIATKEIIKKTEMSFDEKERIFNLVKHSHWLVENSADDDIAFYFRRPHDFEMAQIFEKADSESSGFEYAPNPERIAAIKANIDKINSTGIPVFVNSLPTDLSKYDVNKNGVRYIDLRDPEASVEKYGYPEGTKVKDLKFLCHATTDDFNNFNVLCDDSKDVCLSTMMLDYRSKYSTGYNSNGAYILSGNNANIVLGDKNTSCTGGHRGYDYAKNSMYQTMENLMTKSGGYINQNKERASVSNQICSDLGLSKEEYLEMYNSICNLEKLEDVSDVELSSGRTVKGEDIRKSISDIQDAMVEPRQDGDSGYTNEFVVYNPKIEGMVVHGNIDAYDDAQVPLVLV